MTPRPKNKSQATLFLVFAALLLGIGTADYFFYRAQAETVKAQAQQQLAAIADLKIQQISNWRKERLGDAHVLRENIFVRVAVSDWLRLGLDAEQREQINAWLQSYVHRFDYREAFLLDAQCKVLAATPGTLPVLEDTRQLLRKAVENRQPELGSLKVADGGDSYMELVTPLYNPGNQRLLGFVVFRVAPQRFLFPLIQSWPVPSQSAETLLLERRGEQVLYLNELRHQKGTALHPALPADRLALPATAAAQGETLVIEASDYRGEAVLAAIRAIPDTPWSMVAKIDMREVRAPLIDRFSFLLAVSALALLAALGMTLYLSRLQRNADWRQDEDERQAAREIARANERLIAAQEIGHIGNWERVLGSQAVWCSEETYRLFEYPRDVKMPTLELFYSRVHPEDRERVRAAVAESTAQGKQYHIAFRVLLPSGEIRHFENTSRIITDNAGYPVAIAGTTQDVTERKQSEERLVLAEKVFDNSPDAIMITDLYNRIVSTNQAFTLITGYAPDEVLGQDPRILSSGLHDAEFYRKMWESLQRRGHWSGEITDRRKSGEIYPKWMTINAVADQRSGKLTHYVTIFSDITERKSSEERIHYLAHHDTLTGLPNRFALESRLEQSCIDARRHRRRLAVLFIDLDRFKVINDTLGHQVGDRLLCEVGKRLSAVVRESDAVGRLGGDEFVVVLPDIGTPTDAAGVAAKIIEALAAPVLVGELQLHTSPSIGISVYPSDGGDADTIMRNADTAMYHAKALGRNNFQFYAEEMNRAASERLDIESRLRHALTRREFALHYQPQIGSDGAQVVGVEALLRWNPADGRPVSPARFIPIAEETGMIMEIGEWVLRTACRQIKAWLDAGVPPLRLAVNVSARQLRKQSFPEVVASALADSGLPAHLLEIEITESAVMEEPEEARLILERLKQMGITLAIDDFGTGYSSLAYLKLFPIDKLKIDRSFVTDIGRHADDAAIAISTIALAHSLGLKAIAEGVETAAQRDLLHAHRCNEFQGFLFSRPLPAADALVFLQQAASGR